jgi:hypothetical protein
VDQSNFQYDKCQVGDMHSYHGDLALLVTFHGDSHQHLDHHSHYHFHDGFHGDSFHHSVIQSMIP